MFLDPRKGFYLIAENDNNIIGQIFITEEWSDWRNANIWWIHRIYVQEIWRNRGVFTSLIQKIRQSLLEVPYKF